MGVGIKDMVSVAVGQGGTGNLGVVWRAVWKISEKKPVNRYVHVFLGIERTFSTRGNKESYVW